MQKLVFDLFPVILFFIAYKMYDIYVATAVIIVAMGAQLVWLKLRKKPLEKTQIYAFIAVLALGGLTLVLHNPVFILWKPTLVNWIIGLVFLASERYGARPLVQKFMDSALDMSTLQWRRLNRVWVLFFLLSGILNLIVAYTLSEAAWVNFKLFGLTGLSLAFIMGQVLFLKDHLKPLESNETNS